jgi:dephospho-CoA kinase
MRIYGLTGGVGSGKSAVAARLSELGFPVLNADEIGHECLAPGGRAADAVLRAFGTAILSSGAIDRAKLAALVFGDKAALATLNAIAHPAIIQTIAERCDALAREGHTVAIVEAALLAENGALDAWLDGLILVTCRSDIRMARLVQLRGMDPAQARLRIDAQTPPERKAHLADWVIENEGTLEQLRERVDEVARLLPDEA